MNVRTALTDKPLLKLWRVSSRLVEVSVRNFAQLPSILFAHIYTGMTVQDEQPEIMWSNPQGNILDVSGVRCTARLQLTCM